MLTERDQPLDRRSVVNRFFVSWRLRLSDQRKIWIKVTATAEVTIDQHLDVLRERTDLIIAQRCGPDESLARARRIRDVDPIEHQGMPVDVEPQGRIKPLRADHRTTTTSGIALVPSSAAIERLH